MLHYLLVWHSNCNEARVMFTNDVDQDAVARSHPVRSLRRTGIWRLVGSALGISTLPVLRNIIKGRESLQLATLAASILPLLCLLLALANSLWKPLPFTTVDRLIIAPESARLAELWQRDPETRAAMPAVEDGTLFAIGEGNLVFRGDTAEHIRYAVVSTRFFETLATRFRPGALPVPRDGLDPLGRPIILSDRFLKRAYAVGSTATLNGLTGRLYGFADDAGMFPKGIDGWIVREKPQDAVFRGAIRYESLWRIKHGVSIVTATEQLASAERHYDLSRPSGKPFHFILLRDYLYRDQQQSLYLAYWIVAALFLIGMTNSITSYCYEILKTQRDFALKLALGASYLSLAGEIILRQEIYATFGWMIAAVIAPVFTASVGDYLGVLKDSWGINSVAILALTGSLVVVWLAALAVSIAQLWIIRRIETTSVLQESSQSVANSRFGQNIQNVIMLIQIALMTGLLTTGLQAGIGYWNLIHTPLGFRTENILVVDTDAESVPDDARSRQVNQLMRSIESELPAQRVGAINYLPLDSRQTIMLGVKPAGAGDASVTPAGFRVVEGDYFGVIGLPMAEGRAFTPQLDRVDGPCNIIINRLLARSVFPGQSAVGRSLVLVGPQDRCEVVGVVGDIRHKGPNKPPMPEMYFPLARMPWPTMTVVAQTREAVTPLLARARTISANSSGGGLAVSIPTSLDRVLEESMRPEHSRALMIAAIAVLAFVITLLGLYGLVARRMASRSKRIALELALGASRVQVVRNVFGWVVITILAGVLCGGAIGASLAQSITGGGAHAFETAALTAVMVALISMMAAYAAVHGILRREPSDVLRWSR